MFDKIYRFTIFESNSFGHGGEKRTAQITEILLDKGIASERLPTGIYPISFSFSSFKKLIIALSYFIRVLKITGWKFHPWKFYKTIRLGSQFKGIFNLKKNENSNVILWESTRMEYSFIIPKFKRLGLKVIALPHNIESFVPGLRSGITNKMSPKWFIEEVSLLKECDIVFTISREETLLLKQMGIKAEYLPYYPTKTTLEYLRNIRKAREKRTNKVLKRKKILLLGSAVNPPTREGIIERINFFREHTEICCDLFVAGYGTTELLCFSDINDNIKLLGELSEDQLSEILTETDILLIHQTPTSGALTRIIETLIAGIPVVANFVSGRDYFGINGLSVYYDDEQLINYLDSESFPIPDIPEYPTQHINRFQNYILELISPEK